MFAAVRNPGLYALNGYFFEEGVPPRSAATAGRIRPNRTQCLAKPSQHPRLQRPLHTPGAKPTTQSLTRASPHRTRPECPDALGT